MLRFKDYHCCHDASVPVKLESFSKSRYCSNSRYFYRNFKNSVKSIAFLCYPGRNSTGRNAIFLNSRYSSTIEFGCIFASISPSAVMIELCLVFGGFERMKQACLVPESDGFCRRSVFLRTSTSIRALWWNDPKNIPIWSFSNLLISVVSSIGGMTVEALDTLANVFWNGETTRPLWQTSSTRPFHCGNYTGNFAKAVLSIHAIFDSSYWNSVKRHFAKGLYW